VTATRRASLTTAERVIDHTSEDFTGGPERYDLIVDVNGNTPLPRIRRVLAERGTLVMVGGEYGDAWIGGMQRQLRALLTSPLTGQRLTMLVSKERYQDLERLADMVAAGALRPALDRVLPLEDTAEAMRLIDEGAVRGKLAIAVEPGAAG